MASGVSDLPTELPAKFDRLFAWDLDRRCTVVREIAGDLSELWQDLGGADHLSAQQRWIVERIVYIRRRLLEHESAVMSGRDPPMTPGEHSNAVNALIGALKSIGLQRQARNVPTSLRDLMAKGSP